MFYRFGKNDVRLAIDLDDLFPGEECVIAGGAPSLADFAARAIGLRVRVPVLAINNAATVIRSTMWVGGDKPVCYDPSILIDPTIMKFGIISRRKFEVLERPWQEWPNTFFFGTKEGFNSSNLLNRDRDLVWWKNTFFIALQLSYRLGFRTVYLAGCGFKMSKEQQYAWETNLDDGEVSQNRRLYGDSVRQLKGLLPHFQERGLRVVSATPESLANEFLPYESADKVLKRFEDRYPKVDTKVLPHSSKVTDVKASLG
jgi:hypothetical protein